MMPKIDVQQPAFNTSLLAHLTVNCSPAAAPDRAPSEEAAEIAVLLLV